MAITPLPSLDRTSPTFKADVDTFFASELPTFSEEVEAARVVIVSAEATATTAAGTAATQAGIAAAGASTATTQAGIATAGAGTATAQAGIAVAAAASITAQVEVAIHGAASKTTPEDSDELGLADSAASFGLKKLTWANLKAGVFAAWGALINGATGKTTPVDADAFAMMDSAESNATKKLTWADLKAMFVAMFAAKGNNTDITSLTITPGYQFGCQLTMPTASATMPVSAGKWQDSSGTQLISISAMTKTTAAWAPGSGNGGRLGAVAVANNTWYDWLLIYNPTTGTSELGFDLPGVVTYPSGYTKSRLIFSAKTNASAQWAPLIQDGDDFAFVSPPQVINSVNPGTSAVTVTLSSIPPGRRVEANLRVTLQNVGNVNGTYLLISDLATADIAPDNSNTDTANTANIATAVAVAGSRINVRTNTSAQIRYRLSNSDANVTVIASALGWKDTRGRNN